MCRSPNYNTVLKQIIFPILWKLVKQKLVLVDYTHLFLRTLNEKDKWEREKEDGRGYFAIDSEIICISHFGFVVTCTTCGHDLGWWSFPWRKKSPFPSAHRLQLGQWKSVQSMYWSEVISIAWAVHQIGACAVHMLSKSRLRVFIVV